MLKTDEQDSGLKTVRNTSTLCLEPMFRKILRMIKEAFFPISSEKLDQRNDWPNIREESHVFLFTSLHPETSSKRKA